MNTNRAIAPKPTTIRGVGYNIDCDAGAHRAVSCHVPEDAPVMEPYRVWVHCSCGWSARAIEGMVYGVVNRYAEHLEDVLLRD